MSFNFTLHLSYELLRSHVIPEFTHRPFVYAHNMKLHNTQTHTYTYIDIGIPQTLIFQICDIKVYLINYNIYCICWYCYSVFQCVLCIYARRVSVLLEGSIKVLNKVQYSNYNAYLVKANIVVDVYNCFVDKNIDLFNYIRILNMKSVLINFFHDFL